MAKTCSNCRFFLRQSTVLTDPGICKRWPPQLFVFPMVDRMGQPGLQQHSLFPPISPAQDCGEHKPRLADVIDITSREISSKEASSE